MTTRLIACVGRKGHRVAQDIVSFDTDALQAERDRADQALDAQLNQAFSRANQSDWAKSLQRLARAQAILWHEAPIAVRRALLARVDQEQKGPEK